METTIQHKGKSYRLDLSSPLDISIPLRAGKENLSAWYVDPVRIEPVKMEGFIGDVEQGGPVNFRNIYFNPHGHGTHTECVGHISKETYSINKCLKNFFFLARVISIAPDNGVITKKQVESLLDSQNEAEAMVIRTLPNSPDKMIRKYSGTNPPSIHYEAVEYLVHSGINHLLIDLPSVDPESDEGKLLAHHAFWEYPEHIQAHRTITELIYVPENIPDGLYLLNLQIASFENDASPSKPVLYKCAKAD